MHSSTPSTVNKRLQKLLARINLSKVKPVHVSILVLGFFTLLIIIANYTGGTTLTGWDNLHSEYAPDIHLYRTLQSSWQEFEGLGTQGGLAYAAELPRTIFVSLLKLALPTNLIRYVEHWVFLFAGVLGAYFLVKKVFLEKQKEMVQEAGATIAGLYYLLNLATMQTFHLPLELFTVHFAVLPWLLLFGIRFLRQPSRRDLFIFGLLNVVGATQSFNPTLFLVFALFLGLAILSHLPKRDVVRQLFTSFTLVLVVVLANLFWALPTGRYVLTSGDETSQTRINQFASEVVYLQNQEYGNLEDIILLRGFWFGNNSVTEAGEFTELLPQWHEHLDLTVVQIIGVLLFMAAMAGIILTTIRTPKLGVWLIMAFLAGLIFLGSGNPPFGFIFEFLRDSISLLREALRFPFTKFSIMMGLVYSIGIGVSASFFAQFLNGLKTNRYTRYALSILPITFVIAIFSFPAFQGFFISPYMRVPMPNSYFEFFDYMRDQPSDTRLLHLPIQNHWGWEYYNWGYQGSGFLWYGIEQPVLSRTFDVWSLYNEQVYREFRTAFYAEDVTQMEQILEKYNVTWLLWDNSRFIPGGYQEEEILNYPSIRDLLLDSDRVSVAGLFGEELVLYKFDLQRTAGGFVSSVDQSLSAGQLDRWYDQDPLSTYSYYNSNSDRAQILAPFRETTPTSGQFDFQIDEENSRLVYDVAGSQFDYITFDTAKRLIYQGQITPQGMYVYASLGETGVIGESEQITNLYNFNTVSPKKDFYIVVNDVVYGPFDYESLVGGQVFDVGTKPYTGETNLAVRVYQQLPIPSQAFQPSSWSFSNCDPNLVDSEVEQNNLEDGRLRVYSKGTYACAYRGIYSDILGDQSIIARVHLNYEAINKNLSYCFVGNNLCLHNVVELPGTTEQRQHINSLELGLINNTAGLQLTVASRDVSGDLTAIADLGGITIEYYELIQLTLTANIQVNGGTSQNYSELEVEEVTVPLELLYENSLNTASDIDQSSGCVDVESINENYDGERTYIDVTSTSANHCVNLDLEVDTSDALLIAFDTLNLQGRQPEICVLDVESSTCAVIELARVNDDEWVRNYYIVPSQGQDTGKGYQFTAYNWAAGNSTVVNAYDDVRVYRIALPDYQDILLASELGYLTNPSEENGLQSVRNSVTSYTIDLQAIDRSHNYLVLKQGYEPGWLMMTSDTSLSHIWQALWGDLEGSRWQSKIYKGWANVWDISSLDRDQTVTLVYVPSYLETIGWLGTVGTIMFLFAITFVKRQS